MRMRIRLAWTLALVTLGALLFVLAALNLGMLWSVGHIPSLIGDGRASVAPVAPVPAPTPVPGAPPAPGSAPAPAGRSGPWGPFRRPPLGMGLGHRLGPGPGRDVLGALFTWSVVAGGVATLAAGGIGWWLAGRTAGPLAELSRAAQRLDLNDLAARVREPDTGDEVAELAGSFNRMAARLHRADAARRQLFVDVAHELRHPVAVVQTQLELVQDGVRPLTAESLAGIQDEVLRLGHLITDLNDLSLADAGVLSLNLQTVTPAAVLTPLAANLEPVAEARGVALDLEIAADAPAVRADPQRLRQVLVNLVTNALRYTPAGGRVTLRAQREPGGELAISVADTGTGIAAADLPQIFERFYRADGSRSRQSGGSGLGLAIASSLVRLHGGRITAESRPGEGSRFTVELPAAAG